MNKSDIINGIYSNSHLKLKESERFVEFILDKMKKALLSGESVKISGFGTFKVVPTKRTIVRDFKTGETRINEPKKKIKFIQSKRIK